MKLSDQTVKWRIILLTAVLALVGFFLEAGPVGGVFALTNNGPSVFVALSLELATLGFLAYLALAGSAVVGLHPSEDEPTPQEEKPDTTPTPATADGESVQERVRVRPDIHQLRMLFTALGGYTLLKGISFILLWPFAQEYNITAGQLARVFQFGLIFTALGWFVLWHFLRWYAQRRRWIRLQAELVGADVTRVLAVIILIKPIVYLVTATLRGELAAGPLGVMSLLLHLTLVAAAALLWFARPFTLRRTITGLCITGGVIILLTILLGIIERTVAGV